MGHSRRNTICLDFEDFEFEMDAVHHPEARSWISSKVKLKSYFDDFKTLLESGRPAGISTTKMIADKKKLSENHLRVLVETPTSAAVRNPDETPGNVTGPETVPGMARLTDEMFQEIAQQCNIDNLKCLQLQKDFLTMANTYDKEKRKRTARYPGIQWFESAPPKAAKGRMGLIENQMVVAV